MSKMTTDTATLGGCIERLRELLAQDKPCPVFMPDVLSGKLDHLTSRQARSLHAESCPNRCKDGLVNKFGPEYDLLRRVVMCNHPRKDRLLIEHIDEGSHWECLSCLVQVDTEDDFDAPWRRSNYWQAAEERDPSIICGPLARAMLEVDIPDESDALHFASAIMHGNSLAALQVVVKVLEAQV